jgi:8-amino-7-oxononanoate synthase
MKRNPQSLDAALADLERRNLRRRRRTIERFPEPGNRAVAIVDGRRVVDFSSNDYLGLARHPKIGGAMAEAAALHGAGSGASHLITGHGIEHERLEEALAEFTGRERAVLFSTGYMANLAAITTLATRGELVLLDRLNHASLIDAAVLSGARFFRYAHADAEAAQRRAAEATVIATDGVFSMDGNLAPLPSLARVCTKAQAWLVVDDAHGLGVVGRTGRGTLEHFGMTADDVPVLMGTLGKAFGTFGAFIAGSKGVIELLIQKARSYIYTTAIPQPVAAAARTALEISQQETWRRERVLALTHRFREAARALQIPLAGTEHTPIQPIPCGAEHVALQAQDELLESGFCAVAIRPPTVPEGTARLRISLSAAHTEAEVDALVEALDRVSKRLLRQEPMLATP